MLRPVDTRVPSAVEKLVHSIYRRRFPEGEVAFVPRAFHWASQCFAGHYADYQPIDAGYHDFEHTLQGTLCLVHLLEGRARAKATPELTQHMFELALLAILFHDTGYLKKKSDREGTGALVELSSVPALLRARVVSVGTVVSNGLRTASVRIELEEKPAGLRPGMFGRVRIESAAVGPTLPTEAVLIKDGLAEISE